MKHRWHTGWFPSGILSTSLKETMGRKHKPGENPSKPGEYVERGSRGGNVPNPRKVTIERGDKPMPPTQKPNRQWERTGPPKP